MARPLNLWNHRDRRARDRTASYVTFQGRKYYVTTHQSDEDIAETKRRFNPRSPVADFALNITDRMKFVAQGINVLAPNEDELAYMRKHVRADKPELAARRTVRNRPVYFNLPEGWNK